MENGFKYYYWLIIWCFYRPSNAIDILIIKNILIYMKYNLYIVYECFNIWFRCWYSYIHCYYYQILNKKKMRSNWFWIYGFLQRIFYITFRIILILSLTHLSIWQTGYKRDKHWYINNRVTFLGNSFFIFSIEFIIRYDKIEISKTSNRQRR